MDKVEQRKYLVDYTFDNIEVEDFLNDPRLLALAQIKFMNAEDTERATSQQQAEIKEMVAYLLNQSEDDELVEKISKRLLAKVYSQEYNQFVQDKNQLTSDYACELREKKLFVDLCKDAEKPKLAESTDLNPLLRYFKECMKQGHVPLPILFKIRNKFLILQSYRLNMGLCESLQSALTIYPELLIGINLTDNGMQDSDLAKVINGLTKLHTLKKIVIKNNIFNSESCE